jgi:hypothetical protein
MAHESESGKENRFRESERGFESYLLRISDCPMPMADRIQKKRQFVCSICHKEFKNNAGLSIHFKWCRTKQQKEVALKNGELICDFGCGQVAHYLFKSGNVCCSNHTSRCPVLRKRDSLRKKGRPPSWMNDPSKGMRGKTPWNKGLTVDDYAAILGEEKAAAFRENLHRALQGRQGVDTWARMSDHDQEAAKQKIRTSIRQRYDEGWMPKAGRCKKIWYQGPVCGKVSLDGFWELLVAIYFDALQLDWIRNTVQFDYINLKGKKAKYTPDFYVKDWGKYIE